MLEDGDTINVSQDGGWHVDVSQRTGWDVYVKTKTFVNLPVKTPFTINLSQVEYCKGGMNPETNNYELKVSFCSGRELWVGGEAAAELLRHIDGAGHKRAEVPELEEKFRAKMK